MSNHDIEGHVPPESAAKAANPPSGAPDSLERQLAKEREARQLIRDRLRHTEALAAESHALRAQMAEELERVTADRDRLRAEATIAAAIATEEPAAPRPASGKAAPGAADTPRPASARASARAAEPTMSPPPPRTPAEPRRGGPSLGEHPLGERPLKPPVRRGPWRALAMLGGLAAAGAGLAWLTGTMPSGLDLAASPAASATATPAAMRAASATALAMAARYAASAAPSAAAMPPASALAAATPQHAATPLPPLTPESRLAAAPTAAGPTLAAASAAAPSPAASLVPPPTAVLAQSQAPAAGGLDARLRKALDAEGIAAGVEVDPANGHVLVADPQADRPLRDRTDMLIRAVYAGASLPEPQIEHRWMSPMHGERPDSVQAQAATPANAPPRALALAQPQQRPHDEIRMAPPAAGVAARHVESVRTGEQRKAATGMTMIDAEELRPVLPSGRFTAGCMEDIAGKTSNRRAALTACMKHSCCSSSASLNTEECRAYQKAYPYTCGGG